MSQSIYLDHAAATPLDSKVLAAMQPYLTDQFYNPSATYLAAKSIRHDIDDARARTAKALGVRPREIVFTAGASEANNLAIHGVMARYPEGKILVSAIEHDSVLAAARQYNHAVIPVDANGHVNLIELAKLVTDDVVLVSIMYANNEIGTIQHFSGINAVLSKIRDNRVSSNENNNPLYLHTDAAQAPNLLSVLAKKIGIDLMSLNGGKIYGPKQSGALYVATGIELEPLIYGGGQEFGLRSGTENVAGIVGFSHALEKAVAMRRGQEEHLSALRLLFYTELEVKVPNAVITAPGAGLFNIVHLTIPGTDNERMMMELDERGIMCAVGSACSASSDEPSHVLKAIGLTDEQAQTSLRFTMGRSTTEQDVRATVAALAELTS